ncbi:MAG: diguanylate cyclase [Bacteroidota bacterium]
MGDWITVAFAGLRRKILSVSGAVALLALAALVTGIMIGSLAGRIVCGLIVGSAGVYFFARRQVAREQDLGGTSGPEEEAHSQPREGNMKKLLFDDYQSAAGKYQVRQVNEEDEKKVIPSSRTAQPVSTSLTGESVRQMEIPDFFDLDADTPYTETEPKSEFHSLVNKVLLVLKEVLFAHSVAYFWVNREKNTLVLESMATDSDLFMNERRFAIENDLVSQVALSGKPQLLGRINPASEKELLRYYQSPSYVKSALGVPVFFMDRARGILPVGVIVADSKAEDAFGRETLELLGRFTKLVSALIKSYTDKYDLLLDSELLASIRRMHDRIRSDAGELSILDALADEAHRLAHWEYLTVAMYADDRRGWSLQKIVNRPGRPYVAPDQMIDVQGSIVGSVIASNKIVAVPDLGAEERVRFYGAENLDRKGAFLCVPISSVNRCYGALTLERSSGGEFAGSEAETIYRLVEDAAASLEVLYMNSLVKDFVAVDHLTGSLTRKHFLRRLEEEIRRAEDFSTELSSVSVAIDGMPDHQSRYGREGCDVILNETAKILRANIRPYDTIGRLENDRLGVLLINTPASDAYLWAEKMRKLISSHVMTVGARSFSVTVSAGVCGLSEGMGMNELVAGTTQVLGKALEHGGNLVRVY